MEDSVAEQISIDLGNIVLALKDIKDVLVDISIEIHNGSLRGG